MVQILRPGTQQGLEVAETRRTKEPENEDPKRSVEIKRAQRLKSQMNLVCQRIT